MKVLNRRARRRALRIAGASLLALAGAVQNGEATAQTVDDGPQGSPPQDIVVTARRSGEESVQDVPMAISVLSPNELSKSGTVTFGEVLAQAPSVSFEQFGPGNNRVTIRGLVNSGYNNAVIQDRSLVALYLDDIPLTLNGSNPELRAVDLERVEVLRGPQGTLYGAGSMAGTIRYITAKPDSGRLFGSGELTGSVTEGGEPGYSLRGSANIPLAQDALAVRLGAFHTYEGGFVDNLIGDQKNVNSTTTTQLRFAARATPLDGLTLDASVFYLKSKTKGDNSVYRELGNRRSSLTPEGFDDDLKIFNFTAEYDFGPATLLSSTSYMDRYFINAVNSEALVGAFFGPGLPSPTTFFNKIENFTQEVRLLGTAPDLTWQAGFYYAHDKRYWQQDTLYLGIGIPAEEYGTPGDDFIFYGITNALDEQWALFGEITYSLTERLELTGGLRYFNFRGPATFFQTGPAGADLDGSPLIAEATEKANGFNPRFVARFKISDNAMVFAEAARGFRYGGVNYAVPQSICGSELPPSGAPLTFGPDSVWTYTLGEKADFADGRIRINATAFYIKWTNAQTQRRLSCAFDYVENSGELSSKGIELETVFKPARNLTIGVNIAHIDVKSETTLPASGITKGDRAPFSPRWTGSASVDYVIPLGAGDLSLSADYSYRGSTTTGFDPTNPLFRKVPPASLLNASVTYDRDGWEAGVFVRNILDNELVSNISAAAYPTSIGDSYAIGRPRSFGVRLAKEF